MSYYNHRILQHISNIASNNNNIVNKKLEKKLHKESFIQVLWNECASNRSFITTSGKKINVIYPGTWNDEPGPDFLHATLSVDNQIITGDVEIHRVANHWYNHQHQNNPNFQNVILHVVWQDSSNKPDIPTVVIKDQLPEDIAKLEATKKYTHYTDNEKFHHSILAPYLILKSDQEIQDFFNCAAVIRFNEKVLEIKKNIAHIGRERTLIYALADALGYKNNRQQFYHLVDSLNFNDNHNDLLSQIWGTASLIPDPTKENIAPELQPLVRTLWHNWWLQRMDDLPEIKWSKLGRPLNSPFRRIAAFALILTSQKILPELLQSMQEELNNELIKRWRDLLTFPENIYEQFVNFNKKLPKPVALLGKSRIDTIIINVLLIFYAAVNPQYETQTCEHFISFKILECNHLIKEAINRFFIPPARAKIIMTTNGCQQGMIKMIKLLEHYPHEAFTHLISELMKTQKK